MKNVFQSTWPLFLGIILLVLGNGLQGTLLGVRATMEGFSTATTGTIMSLYSAGYLAGSVFAPKMVSRVGHIRVFAALASLASAITLLHGVFIDPVIWGASRIITGFCFSGLYIVIESWMNDISTNENRGKILGTYLVVFYMATMSGQFLMNLAPPDHIELFIVVSILISIALLPLSLSNRPAPDFHEPHAAGIKEVWRASPLGVVGIFFSGLGNSIFFALGPVFALKSGLEVSQIASFMAVFPLGAVIAQLPLGLLSDKVERRKIIIGISFSASAICIAAGLMNLEGISLYLMTFLYGCMALSLYGICAAYTNDHLKREQFVGASATLILVNGCGSIFGPFTASMFMTLMGQQAFFPLLGAIYASICIFALYRTLVRPPLPVAEQGNFVSMHHRVTPVAAQIAEDDRDEKL